MINSNAEYVDWVRGGQMQFSGLEDDVGVITYTRSAPGVQNISILNPSIGGPLTGGSVSDFVTSAPGGGLRITSTSVTILSYAFSLAFFMALNIDWGRREPIIWLIEYSSDEYTFPYTLPVFTGLRSDSYFPSQSTLSAELQQF